MEQKKEHTNAEPQQPQSNTPHIDRAAHLLTWVLLIIIMVVFIVVAFGVGVWVGQERAKFSFGWAENYHRNFGGPMGGFFSNLPNNGFINGHGIFGSVIKVDPTALVIKDAGNVEETVTISSNTTIRNNSGILKPSDLKVGDSVVIIGSPDGQGQIQAEFIRVLPPSSSSSLQKTIFIKIYEPIDQKTI